MFETLQRSELRSVCLIPLLSNIAGSMAWSISVLYAMYLDATLMQINLITAIWGTMAIVLQVPFGILSDRFGRKPMLMMVQAMNLFGITMRALATSPTHLVMAAFVGGFAGGGTFPILASMIGDLTESKGRIEALSTLYFFSALGMFVGPIIGSVLLAFSIFTLRNIYQLNALCEGLVSLYIIFLVKNTNKEVLRTGYKGKTKAILQHKTMQGLILMAPLYSFFSSVQSTYIPVYSRNALWLSDSEIASFQVYRNLGILATRSSLPTILKRASPKRVLLVVLILSGVVGLTTSYAQSYAQLAGVSFLYGIGFGAIMVLGSEFVNQAATSENRGRANSIYSIFQSSGTLIQMVTPLIVEGYGLSTVFILGGLAPLLATIAVSTRIKNENV